jgi:transcription elongation GreA/GreB family factor
MSTLAPPRAAVSPARVHPGRALHSDDDTRLTPDGRLLMEVRLAQLVEAEIPAVRDQYAEDDGTEVAGRLERLCVEALWLRRVLDTAATLPPPSGDRVELGSYVRLRLTEGEGEGEGTWVRPVHPVEAFLDDERLPATTPLARALLGAHEGDTVTVEGPGEPWTVTVLEISTTLPGLDD